MRAAEASNRLIRGNGRYTRWSQTQLLRQVRWIGSRKSTYQQSFQPAVRLLRRPAAAGGANCCTRSTGHNLEGQSSHVLKFRAPQPQSIGSVGRDQWHSRWGKVGLANIEVWHDLEGRAFKGQWDGMWIRWLCHDQDYPAVRPYGMVIHRQDARLFG